MSLFAKGVQAIEDIMRHVWRIDVSKALDPIDDKDFLVISKRLADALKGQTRATEKAALDKALSELDVDWPALSSFERQRVIRAARAALKQVPDKVIPQVQQTYQAAWTTTVNGVKTNVEKEFGFHVSNDFSKKSARVAKKVAESQAHYVRNQYGKRDEALSEKARKIVAEGIDAGHGRNEIGARLKKELSESDDARADSYWSMAAGVFIARARSWAAMHSYKEAGLTRYTIMAVLDEATTLQCRLMDGKTFTIESAIKSFDAVDASSDPEDVQYAQPWLHAGKDADGEFLYTKGRDGSRTQVARVEQSAVGQKDEVGKFRQLRTDDELAHAGILVPPFHANCRTTIVPDVTSVASMEAEIAAEIAENTPKPKPKPSPKPKPAPKPAPVEQPAPPVAVKPVEQPKPAPIEQPKPAEAPVLAPAPKPVEQPKPIAELPKPQPAIELPKPKPVKAPKPKPVVELPKPVEAPKPAAPNKPAKPVVETPKPAAPKPVKPAEKPKPLEPVKPAEQPKAPEPKPAKPKAPAGNLVEAFDYKALPSDAAAYEEFARFVNRGDNKHAEYFAKVHGKPLPDFTPEEKEAANSFSFGYDYLIRALDRGVTRSELYPNPKPVHAAKLDKAEQYVKTLNKMFETRPVQPTATGYVYRGMYNVGESVLKKFFAEKLDLNAMSSSTTTPGIAKRFADSGEHSDRNPDTGEARYRVLLKLKNKRGYTIQPVSDFSGENEVLLPKSEYRITKASKHTDPGSDTSYVIIEAEEL